MFDVYMHAHAFDPRARRKAMAFMTVAAIATTVALGSALVGERLDITRVGAPKIAGILVMPADELPAPLASPPPGGDPPPDASSQDAVDPETPPDPTPQVRPRSDVAPLDRGTASTSGTGVGSDVIRGTNPLGVVGTPGLPCVVPGTCAKVPPLAKPRPTPTPKRSFESIDVVRAKAKHAPDPSHDRLARTAAGQTGKSGTSRVGFCIGIDGKTTDVRTKASAGDGDVDRICRETVAGWRFEPMRVEDAARVTCSEVAFHIAFE